MARLKKVLLAPKIHYSPDGTLDVTPDRLKHWESTFRRMTEAGHIIPISWDHSEDPSKLAPIEMSASPKKRSAQHTVGKVEEMRVADDGNGLEVTVSLPDEKAAKKATDNIVGASPVVLKEWTDGNKTVFTDCITHFDLVNHPVDSGQKPFIPVEPPVIACSSLRVVSDSGKPQLYRMAGEEVGGTNDNLPNGTTDNPDLPTDTGDEEGKRFEAIVAHLETFDIVLPSDTDKDNFMDRLLTGLMTAKAAKDRAAAEDAADDDDDKDDDMNKATEAQPQFAAMSLQAQAAHGYAERSYRKDLSNRLDGLLKSGKCTPAELKSQKEAMGAVKLSLNAQGEPDKGMVELWLESREALPAGAVWPSEQRLRMATEAPVPNPTVLDEITDEQADDVVDQVFKRKPRKTATANA
jgi:hypothetical protein